MYKRQLSTFPPRSSFNSRPRVALIRFLFLSACLLTAGCVATAFLPVSPGVMSALGPPSKEGDGILLGDKIMAAVWVGQLFSSDVSSVGEL